MPHSTAATHLIRYWVEVQNPVSNSPATRHFGVTAYSFADMLALLQGSGFYQQHMVPIVVRHIAQVDISTLDPLHVLPNMGVPTWRGIWFPQLS
jgi:hypothetical protein